MALDFINGGGVSALQYAYYTVGNSTTGIPIVTGSTPTITWFAWFNCDSAPGALGECLGAVVNMPAGFGGYEKDGLFLTSSRLVQATAGNTLASQSASSASAFSLNTWNCGAASIEANSVIAYLNGVAGTENTGSWHHVRALEETISGAYPTVTVGTFNRPFKGCLAHLTAWNIILSPEQHTLLATGVLPTEVAPENVILYVPYADQGTATTATYNGAPHTLSFQSYNSVGGGGSVATCASSPSIITTPETCIPAVTFSLFKNTTFHDWVSESAAPQCGDPSNSANYESCMTTYYHLVDDNILWMQSPYVYTYIEDDSRNASNPSLLMTGKWDWSETGSTTHKHTREIQLYKNRVNQTVSNAKNRVNGTGRALQLEFCSEEGKDWSLLGWNVWFDKNAGY